MRATYPDGRRFTVPSGDAMYAQVFVHGSYEPAESTVVAGLLRAGDLAVDAGANFGWFSLLMASAVGVSGKVLSVEPVPPMLEELTANLALNPAAQVEVVAVALGGAAGVVKLNLFEGLVHGHASISTLGRHDFVSYEARQETLDQLLTDQPRPPAFIKVDVEGAERGVIAGSRSLTAGPTPPIWMLEVNFQTAQAFGYRPADLVADLRAVAPHAVYRVTGRGLQLDAEIDSAPHGTTWVCVPESHSERVAVLAREWGRWSRSE